MSMLCCIYCTVKPTRETKCDFVNSGRFWLYRKTSLFKKKTAEVYMFRITLEYT